jgi:hypothetical protein
MGISDSDMHSYEKSLIQTSGLGADSSGRITKQLQAEGAMKLGEGSQMAQNQFARQGGAGAGAAIAAMLSKAANSQLWDVKVVDGKISGMPLLGEKMGQLLGVQTEMYNRTGGVDTGQAISLMGAFGGLGGKFSDQSQGSMMSAVHQGISNPSNDFMKAEIMSVLAKENPELSPARLKKKMKEGIHGEGNFASILRHFQGTRAEGSDELFQAVDTMTGGDFDEESVVRMMNANPDDFENLGKMTEADMAALFEKMGFKKMADARAGEIAPIEAKMQNELANAGLAVIKQLAPLVSGMIQSVDKLIAKISELLDIEDPNKEDDFEVKDLFKKETYKNVWEMMTNHDGKKHRDDWNKVNENNASSAEIEELKRKNADTKEFLNEPHTGINDEERASMIADMAENTRQIKILITTLNRNAANGSTTEP